MHDQGGYFIINGGEKVIVAQEKMADNFVYVFKKKPPSKYSWVAEIRSNTEGSIDAPKTFKVELKHKSEGAVSSQDQVYCEISYINDPIPLVMLFRALGYDRDQDIFEVVCGDMKDSQMMEILRGSFEGDISLYRDQEECLLYIADMMKGYAEKDKKEKLAAVRNNFNTRFLPHLGTDSSDETIGRKGYFLGYMVQRMLNAALGRTAEDDRDNYGKKRLELAGVLVQNLFKQFFRQQRANAEAKLKNQVKRNPDQIRTQELFDPEIITRGLRQALATGNWPGAKKG